MSIAAMKQALEALEDVGVLTPREWQAVHKNKAASLRQAIAEAEEQEPFGIWHQGPTYEESDFHLYSESGDVSCPDCIKLYTHPQSKRKPLTDAELAEFSDMKLGSYDLCLEVEARLKEKNT